MKSEEALEQIAYLKELTAKTRLKAADSYPHFILWGIIVFIGYLGTYILSTHKIWFIVTIGAIISCLMGFICSRNKSTTRLLKQIGLQFLILVIAGILIFIYLLRYHDESMLSAFPSFQFGIIYLVASVHLGRNLMFVGLWMIFASAISLIFPVPFHDIWLAISIGGGLLSTGILFRNRSKKTEKKNVE